MNCFNAVSSTAREALTSGIEEGTGTDAAEDGGLTGEADSGDIGVWGRKDLLSGGADRTA